MDVLNLANDSDAPPARRPKTLVVLALLVVAAGVLSYFVAYPLHDALRSAELIPTPPPGVGDPRRQWLVVGFASVLAAFAVAACAFRMLSGRQLRRIDEMADEG